MTISSYGSLELRFSYPPSTALTIEVRTNVLARAAWTLDDGTDEVTIIIGTKEESGNEYAVVQTKIGDDIVDQSDFLIDISLNTTIYDVRLVLYNSSVFLYINQTWVYFYTFSSVIYPTLEVETDIYAIGASTTITNIQKTEIPDGREAIWVDYEASSESVVQSIIQQRPLEIFPEVDRQIGFTYDATKDDVNAHFVESFNEQEVDVMGAAADGLVYGIDVAISQSEETAAEIGFVTRLFRLSELDTGMIEATKILQEKALEMRYPMDVAMRMDPRIEQRDVLVLEKLLSGTNRSISKRIIVASMNIALEDGDFSMKIQGRRDL